MSHGYVVVNGVQVPITRMVFRGGKLHLTCSSPGPFAPHHGEPLMVTVFGEDGQGVSQALCYITWDRVREQDTLTLEIDVAWSTCYGDAEPQQVSA